MIEAVNRRLNARGIFLLFGLLLAFYIRIDEVGNWPVRWDEAFSVWEAQMGFPELTEYTAGDVHPPLYFWALHIWVRLAGTSEFAIRALSVYFGLISILVIYFITLQLSKQKLAAVLAFTLVTLSPFHIQWSQDARMYALATMFACVAVYAYCSGRTRMLVVGGIGAILSHYFGAIVLGVVLLHRVLHWRDIVRGRRNWIIAVSCIVAVCAVWAVYSAGLIRKDPGFATFDPITTVQLMATLFTLAEPNFLYTHFPYVLIITTIYFTGLFLHWRANRHTASLLILGAIIPPLFISLLSLPFIPVHVNSLQERHFVIFSPFIFAGYGISLAAIVRRRWLRWIGFAVFAGICILNLGLAAKNLDDRYFKDDYRTMMAAIATLTNADDRVFFTSGGRKPHVYYHLDQVGYDVPKNVYAEPINVVGIPRSSDDVAAMMEWVFAGIPRFWLIEIEAHLDEPLDARTDWIKEHYHRVYHIPVGWNGISFYSLYENDTIPDIETIIPPVVTEARPADQVRIGVPAGVRVDLVHSGQTVDTHIADTWMLHQFDIYSFYFNGLYELRVADESYSFAITHSQDFPGDGT